MIGITDALMPTPKPFVVRGYLFDDQGKPLAGKKVEIFNSGLKQDVSLGAVYTQADGSYEIEYTQPESAHPNLYLQPEGLQPVDIALQAEQEIPPIGRATEYVLLAQKVQSLLPEKPIAQLDGAKLRVLAQESGCSIDQICRLQQSAVFPKMDFLGF